MHNLVIIGGGGAGLTAALTAKKTNHEADVTLITNERLSYSPCALPFVIGGEIDIEKIAKGIEEICENSGINCVIDEAISIDTEKKVVETKKRRKFPYDSLIIATGGIPRVPLLLRAVLNAKGLNHSFEELKELSRTVCQLVTFN